MKNRHKKENKSTKKHRRIFWIFVFFLVVGIGVTSYILLFSAYTRQVEREAMATGTVQEEIYSFKSRRDLLSLTPEVKRAALYGRATEIDYGTYTLTEIKAPSGYTVLADSIIITVDGKGITVSENDKVEVAEDGITIIVKNDMLYSLPSTGGSGIYWFSICGMLLMMAAAWIIYKNKCREVLVK